MFSKETRRLAYDIVIANAKFDSLYCKYILNINNVPDFSLYELSAYIMADNKDYCYESNSVDNPLFEKKMVPSLLAHFKNILDKDSEKEFVEAWREGIMEYHYNTISDLMDEALEQYNFDQSDTGGNYGFKRG
jgi:hypothetical protein